jgi:thiol-disulfide isomerase/thioredoxin
MAGLAGMTATAQDAAPATAPTTAPTLAVGGAAPAFVGKFIKGDAITDYEPGKVYVIEFWATWCLPCRAAIPHINGLHNEYKDKGVIFIGQSVWENEPEAAPAFVKQMGDQMSYRIALDHTDGEPTQSRGAMQRTWLRAAGISGIPSTWIVKDGKVLWIGHPKDLDKLKIEAARSGMFDIVAAKRQNAENTDRQKRQAQAQQHYWDAVHDKDAAAVDAALKELEEFFGSSAVTMRSYRVRAEAGLGHYDNALAMARTYGDNEANPKKAFSHRLQAINDMIVTNPSDAAFLLEVSKMIDALQIPETDNPKGAEAVILKLRAWVTFLRGDAETAIKLQEQAVSQMGDSPFKVVEERNLEGYRAGHAPIMVPRHSRDARKPATKPVAQQ